MIAFIGSMVLTAWAGLGQPAHLLELKAAARADR
jgi:hypothetical protein